MSVAPPPEPPPEWAVILVRFVEALWRPRPRCGHHWHPNYPPGPDAVGGWKCCACTARLRVRRARHRDGRECTRWTS